MGKQTPQLVIAVLMICGLVVLALQNSSPSLALVFLGARSVVLPMGVWLSGAIALGVVTTLVISGLSGSTLIPPGRSSRRRWTVRPERTSPPGPERNQSRRSGRSPQEPPRRQPAPPPPDSRSSTSFSGQNTRGGPKSGPAVSSTVAAEDWQAWGQRTSPTKWESWSDASGNNPKDENLTRRQRQDQQKAETTIRDLEKGWDGSAQETVYVAPGGSDVDDTLDDIADGWEDWESEDNPLADTAYSQGYAGPEKQARRDSIYDPPDDSGNAYQAWAGDDKAAPPAPAADGEESEVYDADYRVIIPPYRPLDDAEEGDRSA